MVNVKRIVLLKVKKFHKKIYKINKTIAFKHKIFYS